jgi:hypothetical protein
VTAKLPVSVADKKLILPSRAASPFTNRDPQEISAGAAASIQSKDQANKNAAKRVLLMLPWLKRVAGFH